MKKTLEEEHALLQAGPSVCPTPTTTCPETKFDFNLM
jgi:hypothetical protein